MKVLFFLLPFSQSLPERTSYVSNIFEMAQAVLDGSGTYGFTVNNGINYGCAGRGSYSAFTGSIGKPVDETDKAFNSWKKCVKCAVGDVTGISEYQYNAASDSCGKCVVNFVLNIFKEINNFIFSRLVI